MGLRLIHTEGKNAGGMARVYRDNDWQEYRVKFYRDGVYEGEESDYHTDNKGDAMATAQLWVKRPRVGNPDQGDARYSVHIDMGENVHANERKNNPEKGPAGSTIQTQAEVNEFVRKMNETVLYATPLGKTRGVKAWEKGEVFQAVNPPHWDGPPFFRSSDAERIYTMGYRTISVVGGAGDGFTIELVMQ